MTEPTEEMKAMARRVVAGVWKSRNENAAVHLLMVGQCDHYREMEAALAAIIETQRKDAELAESANGSQRVPNWPLDGKEIATAIRSGKQYGKAE